MLILSRKTGESLMIGDDIVVTVLDSAQSQIRIGISAPRDVAVHREEIYLRVMAEKMQEIKTEESTDSHSEYKQRPAMENMGGKA